MFYLHSKIIMLALFLITGSTQMVSAEDNLHDVVRDTDGLIVHSMNGNCVRTKVETDHDICAPARVVRLAQKQVSSPQPLKATPSPSREERTVYFKFDRSSLSPESQDRLNTLATSFKSIKNMKEAKIIGFADRIGSSAYNQSLSERRAETVRAYLAARGALNTRVTETRWVGETEPLTHCATQEARDQLIACLHDDRRVEVEIDYLPEKQTSTGRE